MSDCPHCVVLPDAVTIPGVADMVVHSHKELAAAIGAAAGLQVPVERGWSATTEQKDAFVVVIEWHRPSGVTTYRLRPERHVSAGKWRDKPDEKRERKYAHMVKGAQSLSRKKACG